MAKFLNRVQRAFRNATGVRKYLLISTPFAVAGVYKLLREGHKTLPDPSWLIPAFVALGLLTLWFFQRIMELEFKIEPNVKLSYENKAPFVITEPSKPGAVGTRILRVEVENTGTENLPACLLVLESMTDKNGVSGFFTPVGMITQHQMLQNRKGGPFSLRGGQKKFVNIASLDETNPNADIALLYETVTEQPEMRYPNGVPRKLGPYMLDIAIFGGASPIKKRFTLFVSTGGLLQMEPV